jgi:lauroyl/myristoyl acyltransferase
LRLIARKQEAPSRRLFAVGDLAVLLWLAAGAPLSLLPYKARWWLCRGLGVLTIVSTRAAGSRQALSRMAGFHQVQARRIVSALYAARLAAQLDLLRGLLRRPDLSYTCRGLEHLDAALAQGRGAVLWVSDFTGGGEAVKVALARAGYRMSHLSRPEHGFSKTRFAIRFLNPIRIRFERAYLRERVVYDRMRPKEALSRLMARLAENGVVSITASAHEGRLLAEGPFFAGRLRLAAGAPKLARRAGAALIPVHAVRDPARPDRFNITLGPPLPISCELPEDEAILAAAGAYLEGLEELVRRRPESWGGWRRLGSLA